MFQGRTTGAFLPLIALLTDFGVRDGYVGVMKAVIASRVPDACFIDISHDIPPYNVSAAAWVLAKSYVYFPPQTVFLCVIDPGVGSSRLPLAVQVGQWFFVGPDNGIFHYVMSQQPVGQAVVPTNPAYHLPAVSSTFQGRDLFAPVAAALAQGIPLTDLGHSVEFSSLRRLPILDIIENEEGIAAQIVYIDHFGNVITSIPSTSLPDFFGETEVELHLPVQDKSIRERRKFFAAEADSDISSTHAFLYLDSSGYLAIALQNASAALLLGVAVEDPVILKRQKSA